MFDDISGAINAFPRSNVVSNVLGKVMVWFNVEKEYGETKIKFLLTHHVKTEVEDKRRRDRKANTRF